MTLHEVNRPGLKRSPFERPAQRERLAFATGGGDAALPVRGQAPAREDRVHVVAVGASVFQPFQHDEATAFTRDEAVPPSVVDPHVRGAQRPGLREADQLEGVEADVHPASEGEIEVTLDKGGRRRRHRDDGGGTGAIHGVAATVKIEVVADAAGDGIGQAAGEGVLRDGGKRRLVQPLHRRRQIRGLLCGQAPRPGGLEQGATDERPAKAHRLGAGLLSGQGVPEDDARARRGNGSLRVAGVLQGPLGHIEGQPVHDVGGFERALRHAPAHPVELEPVDDRGLRAIGLVGGVAIRVVVVREGEAAIGHPTELAPAREDVFPEAAGLRRTGVTAADAYDGDSTSIAHGGGLVVGLVWLVVVSTVTLAIQRTRRHNA